MKITFSVSYVKDGVNTFRCFDVEDEDMRPVVEEIVKSYFPTSAVEVISFDAESFQP